MPGTLVTDALEGDLLNGLNLAAGGTSVGTAVRVGKPGDVTFVLVTGTVTGTTPSFSAVIEASNDSTFATGVVTVGVITSSGTAAAQSNKEKFLTSYVNKRFVRATPTLGGTTPVYTGAKLAPRQKHFHRGTDNSA